MNVASRPVGHPRRAKRLKGAGASPPPPGAPRASAPWFASPALWSALAALALFLPALGFGFVSDDHLLVEQNPFLRRDGWLGRLLLSDFWASSRGGSGMWRPLTLLTYWLDGRASGWSPAWFHAVNALLHAATAALVATLARRMTGSVAAALLAGLWFAAMPAHVESVAWIAGRTDVLCALFFLLALVLDRRGRREGRSWPGAPAIVALALALASKEAAVPFVAVIAVAEWVEPRPWRERLRWLAPYLVVTLVYLVLHVRFAGELQLPAFVDQTLARRRWAAGSMLPGYIAFLWPWFPHSPELEIALPASATAPLVVAGWALHLAVLASLVLAIRRRSFAAVAIAIFWLPLLPPIAIALLRAAVVYAERLLYLSSAGAALLLAVGVAALEARMRTIAIAVAGLLVLASVAFSLNLVPTWRSDTTLYEAMVVAQPRNAKARVGRAETLIDAGRASEAFRELDAAESLDPRLPEVHVSRALLHLRRAEWEPALARARRALELDPWRPEARLAEAHALFRLGRLDTARARLEGILVNRPAEPAAEALLGQVLLVGGDAVGAIPHLERALRWSDTDPMLWFALGNARMRAGYPALARAALENAVRLSPRSYEAWLRLAGAAHAAGEVAARDAALERAAALPEARDGRAASLARELRGAR